MSVGAVLLPLFVEVALTFGLIVWLAVLRQAAFRQGLKPQDIALGEPAWPKRARQVSNAFSNQFQLPVLFYVLTALALLTHKADLLFVVLAWVFVILRLVHAAVHTGPNVVPVRGAVYGLGVLVLFVMWVIFAAGILTAPALP